RYRRQRNDRRGGPTRVCGDLPRGRWCGSESGAAQASRVSVLGRANSLALIPVLDLTRIVHEALDVIKPGERVLAVIPDKTRDDNTHVLFHLAADSLARPGAASCDP